MTKQDLITKAAKEAGTTKVTAGKVIKSVLSSVEKALKKGDKVSLIGLGTFYVAKRKARQGRNPATGKPMKIPAAKVPKFRAGKKLKDAV
ncbi:HU family DNA-binding protein [Candidatus Latescibacterota bacterium]